MDTLLHIGDSTLTEEERAKAKEEVLGAHDVFALSKAELGRTNITEHRIETGDHQPIRQPCRRIPFALREEIANQVQDMVEQGIVKPSHSPWASPVVLVRKKDGTLRFCVDYRQLNAATRKDVFPLPRIDDILDQLSGAQYFTTLDLAAGYWQVPLHQSDRQKTAFTAHQGLYEFTVLPFGLCNAPATFQRLMQSVLAGLGQGRGENPYCLVYLDDVIIFSRTLEEHITHLQRVLGRIRQAGLKLKPQKCNFVQEQVLCLGHVVSRRGIAPDPSKVEAVKRWPRPRDVPGVRAFLGFASYYRKFVPGFSKIAGPLHALTRQGVPFQ